MFCGWEGRAGVGMKFLWRFHGYGYGIGTVINPNGLMGILRGFLNRCENQWKRFEHGVKVIVNV